MLKKIGTLFAAVMVSSCAQEAAMEEEYNPAPSPSPRSEKSYPGEPSAISEVALIMSRASVGSHVLVGNSMDTNDEGKTMFLAVKTEQQIEEKVTKLGKDWQQLNHICERFAFVPVIPDEKGKLSALYSGTGKYFHLHELVEINPDNLDTVRKVIDDSGVSLHLQYKEAQHCRLALKPVYS